MSDLAPPPVFLSHHAMELSRARGIGTFVCNPAALQGILDAAHVCLGDPRLPTDASETALVLQETHGTWAEPAADPVFGAAPPNTRYWVRATPIDKATIEAAYPHIINVPFRGLGRRTNFGLAVAKGIVNPMGAVPDEFDLLDLTVGRVRRESLLKLWAGTLFRHVIQPIPRPGRRAL